MSTKRLNLAVAAIVLVFIALSLAYSVVNPLHEATDELLKLHIHTDRPDEVFALFNLAIGDDPGGPGTAPGAHFEVEGLQPVDGDAINNGANDNASGTTAVIVSSIPAATKPAGIRATRSTVVIGLPA